MLLRGRQLLDREEGASTKEVKRRGLGLDTLVVASNRQKLSQVSSKECLKEAGRPGTLSTRHKAKPQGIRSDEIESCAWDINIHTRL